MKNKYNTLILLLIEQVNEAFLSSKSNRRKLHEIEWDGGQESPSILGETEIRATNILGFANKYLKTNFNEKSKIVEGLNGNGVYDSGILLPWLLNKGKNFSEYTLYLHMLEHLRLTLIDRLTKK